MSSICLLPGFVKLLLIDDGPNVMLVDNKDKFNDDKDKFNNDRLRDVLVHVFKNMAQQTWLVGNFYLNRIEWWGVLHTRGIAACTPVQCYSRNDTLLEKYASGQTALPLREIAKKKKQSKQRNIKNIC